VITVCKSETVVVERAGTNGWVAGGRAKRAASIGMQGQLLAVGFSLVSLWPIWLFYGFGWHVETMDKGRSAPMNVTRLPIMLKRMFQK
jgi:hypothetical protein